MTAILLQKGHPFTAEEERIRRRWALKLIPKLEGMGQALGYSIFHAGSLVRDIDLIAWPVGMQPLWPNDPERFVKRLCEVSQLNMHQIWQETRNGHFQAQLWHEQKPDHIIDLKVVRSVN